MSRAPLIGILAIALATPLSGDEPAREAPAANDPAANATASNATASNATASNATVSPPTADGRLLEYETIFLDLASDRPFTDDERQMNGTDLRAAIPALRQSGLVARLVTLRSMGVEEVATHWQVGEEALVESTREFRGRPDGFGPQGVPVAVVRSRTQLGTLVGITGLVRDDGKLSLEVTINESRLAPRAINDDERAPQAEKNVTSTSTTVSARDGETILLSGFWSDNDLTDPPNYRAALILLTARVADSSP